MTNPLLPDASNSSPLAPPSDAPVDPPGSLAADPTDPDQRTAESVESDANAADIDAGSTTETKRGDAGATTDDGALDFERDRWRRALIIGLVAYVVSRICVLAGATVRASQVLVDDRKDGKPEMSTLDLISGVFTSWDGNWYLELVRNGYPESIPANVTFDDLEARAAFFPMFPSAVRLVDAVLPGGDTFAALFLNLVLGGIAVMLIGLIARKLYSTTVAARSMVLFSLFPGSFVLSFAYSEALFIVFAAAALLFLLDEEWLIAGLAAALATATRPNGVAIVLACVVAAGFAVYRRRDWMSLIAVLLAPIGFIGFQLYVDDTTGERGAWFRVQREAWSEGTSFGVTAVTNTFEFISSPFDSSADALTVLSLASVGVMAWAAWKAKLSWVLVAFSAVVIALMLIPETVTARPRFVFTAFPLFIAVAAWWPQPTRAEHIDGGDDLSIARQSWNLMLLVCGAGLAALTNLYGVFGAIP